MGPAFLALQVQGAAFVEGLAELDVTLLAESELACRPQRPGALALALDEHGELARDLIVGPYGEGRVALGGCPPRAPTDPYVRD